MTETNKTENAPPTYDNKNKNKEIETEKRRLKNNEDIE
jgi:hypothetical protein